MLKSNIYFDNFNNWLNKDFHKYFFYLGVVVFFAGQMFLMIFPISNRYMPFEPDDAYTYIFQSVEIYECPLKDCVALIDLEKQFSQVGRIEMQGRVFNLMYPLYTAVLGFLFYLGIPLELGFYTISFLGGIVLWVGIARILRLQFGDIPTGLTLLFLSFQPFTNAGYHIIIPWNIALGISLHWWVGILQEKKWAYFYAPIFTLVAFIHQMGILFVFVSFFIIILKEGWRKIKNEWLVFFISAVVLISIILAPKFIKILELNSTQLTAGIVGSITPTSYISFLSENMLESYTLLKNWTNRFGTPLFYPTSGLIWGFVLLGGYILWSYKRSYFQILGIATILMILGSIFIPLNRYPGEIFLRFWVFGMAYVLGLFSLALIFVLHRSYYKTRTFLKSKTLSIEFLILGLFTIFGLQLSSSYSYFYLRDYWITLNYRTASDNLKISHDQIEYISNQNDYVLIDNDNIFLYSLSHGLLHSHIVYGPYIIGSDYQKMWIDENPDLSLALLLSPMESLPGSKYGGIQLNKISKLEFVFQENIPPKNAQIWVRNYHNSGKLQYSTCGEPENIKIIDIDQNFSGWIQLFIMDAPDLISNICIYGTDENILLGGIKTSNTDNLMWPWNSSTYLNVYPNKSKFPFESTNEDMITLDFNISNLFSFDKKIINVLYDSNSTILVEFD